MREAVVVRRRLGFGGGIGAVVAFCLSLTPSLLPRHWALQGVLSGITMAIGYGVGATAGAAIRARWPRLPAAGKRWWLALAGAGAPLAVTFLWLGAGWQQQLRELVGAAGPAWHPVPVALAAAGVFAVLLAGARAFRLGTRRLAGTFGRFSPRPVASVAAVGVVAALSFGLGQQVVFTGFVDVADRFAAAANGATPPGVTRPGSPYVSGGPGSLVPWDTLGAYGREFTAGAVPHHELAEFAARGRGAGAAEPPVRVYVGRESAPDLAGQAELAVRELERTGGFDRSVLAVVATTGTGWVNPAVPSSIEYLTAGDSATVAMQYSYLPSWISFLADRSTAAEAAGTLVAAIRAELATRPAEQRPALVVYGESLGAWGLEAAFEDLDGLLAGTDRAVLAGPPHSNPIWQEVTGDRAPDHPIWQPDPRMVYLQNASDPVVAWSPELLWRAPDAPVRWLPMVTFWQVTVDLMTSTKAPPGHGHSYQGGIAVAWAELLAPPGWTDADTARLRAELA
ncbi:MAG: hypothetical protein GEV12_11225 [Micromonosporaceae bacterium]|nr:hypothetical protein [Micromonosporaceae bacterium]